LKLLNQAEIYSYSMSIFASSYLVLSFQFYKKKCQIGRWWIFSCASPC